MRLVQAHILKMLGERYATDEWTDASGLFQESGKLVKDLSKASIEQNSKTCSGLVAQIAYNEEKAYQLL